jgi:hypothetical protein
VLAVLPPDVDLNVEIKESGVVADLLAALAGVENDVVVSSLHPDPLWRTRMLDESMPLAFNFDVRPEANFETAMMLDCEYANSHWTLCFATDVVERAHKEGMDVHAWPVSSRPLAWALAWRGVDARPARRGRADSDEAAVRSAKRIVREPRSLTVGAPSNGTPRTQPSSGRSVPRTLSTITSPSGRSTSQNSL